MQSLHVSPCSQLYSIIVLSFKESFQFFGPYVFKVVCCRCVACKNGISSPNYLNNITCTLSSWSCQNCYNKACEHNRGSIYYLIFTKLIQELDIHARLDCGPWNCQNCYNNQRAKSSRQLIGNIIVWSTCVSKQETHEYMTDKFLKMALNHNQSIK